MGDWNHPNDLGHWLEGRFYIAKQQNPCQPLPTICSKLWFSSCGQETDISGRCEFKFARNFSWNSLAHLTPMKRTWRYLKDPEIWRHLGFWRSHYWFFLEGARSGVAFGHPAGSERHGSFFRVRFTVEVSKYHPTGTPLAPNSRTSRTFDRLIIGGYHMIITWYYAWCEPTLFISGLSVRCVYKICSFF